MLSRDDTGDAEDRATDRRTRGGHRPTGTSANRRARAKESVTRKGEQSRSNLIAAARRIFERDGYVDARVSDIVGEAGVAHGSFYTYFPSKLEVFRAIIEDLGDEIRGAVSHAPDDVPGDTVSNLWRANHRYLEYYERNAAMLALLDQVAKLDPDIAEIRISARRRHVERIATTIRRLQERGLADAAVDASHTAAALIAMLSSYAYWSTVPPMDADIDTTTDTVTAIWVRAIGLQSETED